MTSSRVRLGWTLVGAALLGGGVLFLAGSATADIAPDPLVTGGTSPQAVAEKQVPVRMAWEEVDLHPSSTSNRVEAAFGLVNTSEVPVHFEVGFPSYFEGRLEDFEVRVDGQPVAAEAKRDDPAPGARKRIFKYWMCWPMDFAPGAEVRVDVRYACATGKTFEHLWLERLPPDLKHRLWTRTSGYVLRTGSAWAGSIGQVTVRLHYSDEVTKDRLRFVSGRGLRGGRFVSNPWTFDPVKKVDTLVLRDMEPIATDDIAYEFSLVGAKERVALLLDALEAQRLDPWAMEHLRELVEEQNLLGLDDEERRAKVRHVLGWMVPPKGPRFAQSGSEVPGIGGPLSAGAEGVLLRAFRQLLPLLREEGDTAAHDATVVAYRDFLEPIVQRKQAWYDAHPDKQKGRSWNDHRRLQAEWMALVEATAED